jgi:hypothetical protein
MMSTAGRRIAALSRRKSRPVWSIALPQRRAPQGSGAAACAAWFENISALLHQAPALRNTGTKQRSQAEDRIARVKNEAKMNSLLDIPNLTFMTRVFA